MCAGSGMAMVPLPFAQGPGLALLPGSSGDLTTVTAVPPDHQILSI